MPSSIDYLISTQQEAGGWGYLVNHRPVIEPTALALLAIRNDPGAEISFQHGVSWLLSCQHTDGGWGINEDDPESGWQTSWALIALRHTNTNDAAITRGVDWLTHVGTSQITHEEYLRAELPVSNDPGAMIWPWLPSQVGWIEPTALAILALASQNLSQIGPKRIEAALAYFRSSRTPSGGWDIGNAGPLDTIVLPRAFPTALVLLALHRISQQEIQTNDLSALYQDLQRDPSVLSQSAGLLAIQTLGENSEAIITNLTKLQHLNGSWDDNPFFTAWASIGLRGHL